MKCKISPHCSLNLISLKKDILLGEHYRNLIVTTVSSVLTPDRVIRVLKRYRETGILKAGRWSSLGEAVSRKHQNKA